MDALSETAVAPRSPALGASTLAARYGRCLKAIDGDGNADVACLRFAAWLADRWRPKGPDAPPWEPDAVSVDGRGVTVARWYAVAGVVRGYVEGARGCYVVPSGDTLPDS
jgi:hypothetical protein